MIESWSKRRTTLQQKTNQKKGEEEEERKFDHKKKTQLKSGSMKDQDKKLSSIPDDVQGLISLLGSGSIRHCRPNCLTLRRGQLSCNLQSPM